MDHAAGLPTWMVFRRWMIEHAPTPFLRAYIAQGPAYAQWLKTQPALKARVRAWMESKIRS